MKTQQPSLLHDEITGFYPYPRLRHLPLCEQPATRVAKDSDACSLAELLAVIVGGEAQIEISARLLARFGTIHKIAQAYVGEIAGVPGIGSQTALRLKASLALGRKLLQPEEERPAIHSPADAAQILMPILAHRNQEYLLTMLLDTRNRVMDIETVYHGSLNASMVRIGEVFKPAVERNAASILIAHDHPSGDPSPSPEDIAVTRAIVQAGKLLDVAVVDHVICGQTKWVSLKEKGMGF